MLVDSYSCYLTCDQSIEFVVIYELCFVVHNVKTNKGEELEEPENKSDC